MKAINDKEARQALRHELRRATCLQVSIWDVCGGVIDEILGNADSLPTVIQVSTVYAGKQLTYADLDEVLSGLVEMSPTALIRRENKMEDIANLSVAVRLALLRAFQNTFNMQAELWIIASNLALTLDCDLEYVLEGICELSIGADPGVEIDEMDLRAFLGEHVG